MKISTYLKKFLQVFAVAVIASVVAGIFGYWVFEGSWYFLILPALAGITMSLVQKENKSYKFIGKLLIGSIIFGFAAIFLTCLRMYLILHPIEPSFPLIFNKHDFLILALVFCFVSFLGGLLGIVIKGFYCMVKK